MNRDLAIMTQFAVAQIRSNPNVANSPVGMQFLDILERGAVPEGEQLANTILQTFGETPQTAIPKARQRFNI